MEDTLVVFVKVAEPGDVLLPQWTAYGRKQFPHIAAFHVRDNNKDGISKFWERLKSSSEKEYKWAAIVKNTDSFIDLVKDGPVAHSNKPLNPSDYEVISIDDAERLLH